ncbi:cobaltochelatase subunit CobN [Methylobacterium gossipiicola]|uniref:Cobaltochelatase CobN subunit n=1 Tax=Methylobacterium gossipiicola TaxID=582675 RepID=A0A1I2RIF9_9HYPH|nr:cobaltochelatase subunit CobN [Methylobacterium gossipiicola]SFG37556.1 cobaltochelatase CobN subunit [Methylobacterium gossipiicola]
MHLIRVDTVSLDEGEAAIDLGQAPGDIVFLSFTDSDLFGVAGAYAQAFSPSASETVARGSPLLKGEGQGEVCDISEHVPHLTPALSFQGREPVACFPEAPPRPTLRLAKLAKLRHPMSVDLYVDGVIARSKIVVIRCLGGLDYWRYGIERAAAAARAGGVTLVVLPGDDRPDPRLDAFSTAPALAPVLDAYFRAGGAENLRRMLGRLAAEIGFPVAVEEPQALPRGFVCCPGCGPIDRDRAAAAGRPLWAGAAPLALVVVYRSAILSGDTAPLAALGDALQARGFRVTMVAVSSLKDPAALGVLRETLAADGPAILIAATAFSAREDAGFVLDAADCPVIQAYTVGAARAAWEASARGLAAADLAMQVALPEFDGRLSGFPISFKEDGPEIDGFSERRARPYPEGIAALADRAAAWVRLAQTPRPNRRLAVVLSDYPARGGRAGFAVGLDTPESARAIVSDLREAGYAAGPLPDADGLMRALTHGPRGFFVGFDAYRAWFDGLPESARAELIEAWGEPEADPLCRDGGFHFPMILATDRGKDASGEASAQGNARTEPPLLEGEGWSRACDLSRESTHLTPSLSSQERGLALDSANGKRSHRDQSAGGTGQPGNVALFLQPDRGRSTDRKAGYHDPDAVPTHAYLAFHLGLRRNFDALIHLGTHGTTEWLPGKAVALSPDCWPARAIGSLPVIYPFIVDDPGEAAPLKRRLGGVALGHLTPQIECAGLDPDAAHLRELVEEYSAASILDPRRAAILARTILEEAESAGLLAAAGIDAQTAMPDALSALDAHLCDLGEVTTRVGLHVFGRAAPDVAAHVAACATAERDGLLAALDGRFVPPGPAGSPSRGRTDVMPTGRNLTTLDPRSLPTRAATTLGAKAADAVVRRYLQDEGEYPARIVMDLWASPTLRTGGEDVAHALALMGVRPVWDHASTRVTGFEVLPLALLDRPRIDVTVRVSGAFRDTFPETLALLARAAEAVAGRDEEDSENPLAAARRRGEAGSRVYGAAPGRYGAGAGGLALDGAWESRDDLGRAYLDATSHAYGGAEDRADAGFAARVAQADAYVHAFDVAERDLLDGDAAVEAMGGFAAAASLSGAQPALYSLDVATPDTPKTRTAREEAARLIRGKLSHPRWIAAQLRHGYRGAQELAQGVDAVFVLAATTDAVSDADLDRLYGALIADPDTFETLRAANPEAARAILERFDEARRRGMWQTRRNAMAADELMPEAAE